MTKKKKEGTLGFKIFKAVLGPIFNFYYNPKVSGKENIPAEGAILLVGNHKHIMDQCAPLLSTKRGVRYMAKKEYFDDKKVAWFFKAAGCIPVDRSKKDEDAKAAALDVLNKYFTISNMIVVGSCYWNMVHGSSAADVAKDEEGLQTMRQLARNMAWILKSIKVAKSNGVELPATEKKLRTNFIR